MTRRFAAGRTRVLAAARPRMLALACAAVFGAAIGYSVARIPIQVSDSLVEILEAQRSPSIDQPEIDFSCSIASSDNQCLSS